MKSSESLTRRSADNAKYELNLGEVHARTPLMVFHDRQAAESYITDLPPRFARNPRPSPFGSNWVIAVDGYANPDYFRPPTLYLREDGVLTCGLAY